ncbi:MAG: PHP domain-containing protein [Candidatus Omnitrophica bacterium]|nr:PHP domain-containing protein [Candidatus Omnitrophota bacterium]
MLFADLHLHTIFSDGTYTPEQLAVKAKNKGLSAISVVDHDIVSGIPSCITAGKECGVEVIPGLELSAEYNGSEVHILGYLVDYNNGELIEKLEFLRKNRVERIYRIVEKLKEAGVALDPESVFSIARGGTVGRLHVARAMVKDGLIGSTYEAFQKYLGDKRSAFVLGFKFSPRQAVELIKNSGGIPVLAHPYSLNNDELIPEFVEAGVMGLEVYYPEHSQSTVNFYLELARKYNLLVTGGSDCHGEAKPHEMIGSIKIAYELVEKLKQAKARL